MTQINISQAGVLAKEVFTKYTSVKPLSSSTEPLYSVSFKLTNFDSLFRYGLTGILGRDAGMLLWAEGGFNHICSACRTGGVKEKRKRTGGHNSGGGEVEY